MSGGSKGSMFGMVAAALSALAVIVLATGAFAAAPHFTYTINTIGPKDGGGEPSITIARDGTIYVSGNGDEMNFWRSSDSGATFVRGAVAAAPSGDTSLGAEIGRAHV